jgi:hypothetical protein
MKLNETTWSIYLLSTTSIAFYKTNMCGTAVTAPHSGLIRQIESNTSQTMQYGGQRSTKRAYVYIYIISPTCMIPTDCCNKYHNTHRFGWKWTLIKAFGWIDWAWLSWENNKMRNKTVNMVPDGLFSGNGSDATFKTFNTWGNKPCRLIQITVLRLWLPAVKIDEVLNSLHDRGWLRLKPSLTTNHALPVSYNQH